MAKPKHGSRPSSAARPGAAQQRTANTTTTTKQPVRSTSATASAAANPATRPAAKPSSVANGNGAGTQRSPAMSSTPAARQQAAIQTQSRRPAQRRYIRQSWWQKALEGPRAIGATLITVALLVALFILLAHNQQASGGTSTVPPNVFNQVAQVSPTVFQSVGTGGQAVPLKTLPANTAPLKNGDKPEFLYVGADYCPYCAAERWSVIVALSRFGTFSNLHLTTSADAPEVYPNTPTFTFYKSTYTSQYVSFAGVEMQDRQQRTLQPLTSAQQQIVNAYDGPPYAPQAGAIPFLDIGNVYVESSSGYLPDVLANETWSSIASGLSNPNSIVTQAIVGDANYLTAAICNVTNNQPANVCTAAPIPSIQAKLPKGS